MERYLAEIAARTPAPGGGAVCATAASLAAAVVEMAARFADDDHAAARASALRAELAGVPGEDAAAYGAFLAAEGAARDAALAAAADPPLKVAEAAAEIAELGARLVVEGKPSLRGDALAGVLVAEGAARAAAELVSINLEAHAGDPRIDSAAAAAQRAATARAGAL